MEPSHKFALNDEEILSILLESHRRFLNKSDRYLCISLADVLWSFLQDKYDNLEYKDVYESTDDFYDLAPKLIPEFNRGFCEAEEVEPNDMWWDTYEREPRIHALDKMIACYQLKIQVKP